jgi:nucleoside-diphosphate-sugar epimerase
MKLLLTGATGKLGQAFLPEFLKDPAFANWSVTALCNNRVIDAQDRVEIVKGSLNDRKTIERAMKGATHTLHLAAVKESPDLAIDVGVKGMFLLLEAFRTSPTASQFILLGGDCSVGHIFHDYDAPITEASPRRAYKGCYALTKVLEEVMLEQYQIQHDIKGTILRAPWIMEKDDFRLAHSFGPDQFGGPSWTDFIPEEAARDHHASNHIPVMLDKTGRALKRNFIHIDDLVAAILAALNNPNAYQQTFNISMNEPVDYARTATRLAATRSLDSVEIKTPFHSNLLDNSKARKVLEWAPEVDQDALIDRAWSYKRQPDDPRIVWYPG